MTLCRYFIRWIWGGRRSIERHYCTHYPARPTLTYIGSARVAVGDINGDGTADIITGAGTGGGAHVRVFNGKDNTELLSFIAFDTSYIGGIYVAAGDIDGDGKNDILVGSGPDNGGLVRAFHPDGTQFLNIAAFGAGYQGAVTVAVGDVNGDGK